MWMLALAPDAWAKDPNWGVGGHIGTWGIPNQYPSSLPKVDLDGEGGEGKVATGIEKVRGDFLFGVEGWFWADEQFRIGLLPGIDVGSKFVDPHVIIGADYMFVDGDQLDVFAGGGVGVGSQSFKGLQQEKLVVPYYPLRANIGAMLAATDFLAPQLRLIGQWNVPSSHRYTTASGAELDKKAVGTGFYVNLGAELTVMYGKFN